MAEENKKENGGMMKVAGFIVDKRNLIFLIFVILTVFSAVSRNWVEVENDLTFYLPDDSETKQGLTLMDDEFVTFGTAKVMLANITYDDAKTLADKVSEIKGVQSLTFDDTAQHYANSSALFDITFDYPEDDEQCVKKLDEVKEALSGQDIFISSTIGQDDSVTIANEMKVIIVIVAIVVVSVLILTSETFAEVPVLIITFLSAAIINMGTNYMCGKISFISNSVTIVLQLALSVDYAIIYCNRFKVEHRTLSIRDAAVVALSKAIPEICASSLTTIGGLVAMMFMKFKIGGDMGLCLIKSIFFSLFSVFLRKRYGQNEAQELRAEDQFCRQMGLFLEICCASGVPRSRHRGLRFFERLPLCLRNEQHRDASPQRNADRAADDRRHLREH